MVSITDDRDQALRTMCNEHGDVIYEQAQTAPYLLVGTIAEIVAQLYHHRDRFGISYFVVRDLDNFTPILTDLRKVEHADTDHGTNRP